MLRKQLTRAALAFLPLLASACDATPEAAAPLRPNSGVLVEPRTAVVTALGDMTQLSATVSAQYAGHRPVWSSLDPGVAVVDADGRVVSVARGQARIVAAAGGGADTARVTVTQVPATLSILRPGSSDDELTVIGQSLALEADVRDRKENPIPDAQTTWVALDPEIVTVNANGSVNAKGNGKAKVVGRAGDAQDTTTIIVNLKPVAVAILPRTHVLASLGESVPLAAEATDEAGNTFPAAGVTWSSNASSVATVSSDGTVTAVGNGTARILARLAGNVTDTATITVQQMVATVAIQPSLLALFTGQSEVALATAFDARGNVIAGAPMSWSTGTPSIATVDQTGRVTAVGAGTTLLTASSGGRAASINVAVTPNGVPVAFRWRLRLLLPLCRLAPRNN
jgi:trimeric autotransporter adhesin